jgi:hypothetical protein
VLGGARTFERGLPLSRHSASTTRALCFSPRLLHEVTVTLLDRFRRSPLLATIMTLCMLVPMLPRPAHADASPPSPTPVTSDAIQGPSGAAGAHGGAGSSVAGAHVDGSTGALKASFAIELPAARGAIQPQLALSYSSARDAIGVGGPGWSLSLPAIERHNLSGPPTFADPETGAKIDPAKQDRFTWGGAPLVPICFVDDGDANCRGDSKGNVEQMPKWAIGGWHYYRLEHEDGSLLRFFWSPDHNLWRVQDRNGGTSEYGFPDDETGDTGRSVDRDQITGNVYRWNLVLQWDSQRGLDGAPINKVVYQWGIHGLEIPGAAGINYLTDIYDTPQAPTSGLAQYAHHVHLFYDGPTHPDPEQTVIWRSIHRHALSLIDVTSSTFSGVRRTQVRRYHFAYSADGPSYHLANVTLEGACKPSENNAEAANGILPEPGTPGANKCVTHPPITLTHTPSTMSQNPRFVPIGHPVPTWTGSTGYTAISTSVNSLPTILDVNNDGLPDLVAPPAKPSDKTQSLALNSIADADAWSQTTIAFVNDAYDASPSSMTPLNESYNAGNFIGDGRANVLWFGPHGPAWAATEVPYAVFSPLFAVGQWVWVGGASLKTIPLDMYYHPNLNHDDKSGGVVPFIECWMPQNDILRIGAYSADEQEQGGETKFANADIDGDGFQDLITTRSVLDWECKTVIHDRNDPVPWPRCFYEYGPINTEHKRAFACRDDIHQNRRITFRSTRRDGTGTIAPFSSDTLKLCIGGDNRVPQTDRTITDPITSASFDNAINGTSDAPHTSSALADMNGDGLADWVVLGKDGAHVHLGHGDGVFGICPDGSLTCAESDPGNSTPGDDTVDPVKNPLRAFRACSRATVSTHWTGTEQVRVALGDAGHLRDVNGDGRADLVFADGATLWVYPNAGGSFDSVNKIAVDLTQGGWSASTLTKPSILFADMNGSGVGDIVIVNDLGDMAYVDMLRGVRPHLLTDLDNGLGVTTHVVYKSTADLEIEARLQNDPFTSHTPDVAHVVFTIETKGDASLPDDYMTQYSYREPVYDARDRAFVGFQKATSQRIGGVHPRLSTTTYYQGHCGEDVKIPCTGQRDYFPAAFRGLPTLTEVYDASFDNKIIPRNYLSTIHRTFSSVRLLKGMDGRSVRRVYNQATDTYKYDTSPFIWATIPTTIPDIAGEMNVSVPFTVRSANNAHLRTVRKVDPYVGLEYETADLGRVDSNNISIDGAIYHDETLQVIPQEMVERWTWRVTTATDSGLTFGGSLPLPWGRSRLSRFDYDASGNMLHAYATLSGTTTLQRFHDTPGAPFASDPPPDASKDGERLLATISYRVTGQPWRVEGSNGRCADSDYDSVFGQLPISTTVYLDGCGSGRALASSRHWDRGLGRVTLAIGPSGTGTTTDYDGFGRPQTISRPNATLGAPTSDTTIDYLDIPNHGQRVHAHVLDGNVPIDIWSFLDGFGRPIASIRPADADNDDTPWIVEGQVQRDSFGHVMASYPPGFYKGPKPSSDAVSVMHSLAPSGSAFGFAYDSFDRVTSTSALDGVQASSTVYHALSVERQDAEQIAGGHAGATLVSYDGHGVLRLRR